MRNASLKLCTFIAVLSMCIVVSPASADVPLHVMEYFSVNSLSDENDFFSENEENRRLAENYSAPSIMNGQTRRSTVRGKMKLDKSYFKGILTDAGYIATSPWRWDEKDWATASLVVGTTGAVFFLDDEVRDFFQDKKNSATDHIESIFEPFGNAAFTIPALMGLYVYGQYGENERLGRTALLAVESFLVTGLFTTVLKGVVGRQRPFSGEGSDIFEPFSTGKNSFPSGHTSSAFALATVVANEYEEVPLIKPISYGIATMTALARINGDNHFASDVIFGAALGYFISKAILKLHSNKTGQHFTIYPSADYRSGGLILSTRF
jgi:membrane-associated phospholipid phosphatase